MASSGVSSIFDDRLGKVFSMHSIVVFVRHDTTTTTTALVLYNLIDCHLAENITINN